MSNDERDELNNYIVLTPSIRNFLNVGEADRKSFIAAPKGLGKTLLLKAKSQMYRTSMSGYAFIPERELVVQLSTQHMRVARRNLKAFESYDRWLTIWKITLHLAILRRFDVPLSSELENLLGDAKALPNILRILLEQIGDVYKIDRNFMPQELSPKLRQLQHHADVNQVAMFIDNLDESFRQTLEHENSDYKEDFGKSIETIWMNAQIALVETSRKIRAENAHIRIFASLRSEAFDHHKDSMALQLKNYTTILEYSDEELRQIFEHNINLTETKNLRNQDSDNLFEKFFGFDKIPHKTVRGDDNNLLQEEVFDYVLRHTFRRPREIVYMGEKIHDIAPSLRNLTSVKEKVNQISRELFNQYATEILPSFKSDLYRVLLETVDKNVIPYAQAKRIEGTIWQEKAFENAFSYFWRLGLIGIVKRISEASQIQEFAPVGRYTSLGQAQTPQATDYYLIHPALDLDFTDNLSFLFHDRYNIIGHNLIFREIMPPNTISLHVHVGIDRDSLSLMIPEHAKLKSLSVIYDPNTPVLSELGTHNHILLQTNNNESVKFEVLHNNMSEAHSDSLIEEWNKGYKNIFISARNEYAVRSILRMSDTISVLDEANLNLFKQIKAILRNFKRVNRPYHLYVGRKYWSKNAIRKIAKHYSSGEIIKHALIMDRYSYSYPKTSIRDGEFIMALDTEQYGQLICRYRADLTMHPSAIVKRPRTTSEFLFYSLRQKLLVEGVYRLNKVMCKSNFLLDKDKMKILHLFIEIQIRRVLDQISNATLRNVFQGRTETEQFNELFQFALSSYARVQSLTKEYLLGDTRLYVQSCKRMAIFPKEPGFYAFTQQINGYYNNEIVKALKMLLHLDYDKKMSSVFICYSTKNRNFAVRLQKSLERRGIENFLFEDKKPGRRIKKLIKNEIARLDKLLFVVSESAIQSELCQYELNLAREKQENVSERVLIPVNIDSHFQTHVSEHLHELDEDDEFYLNMQFVKQIGILDFSKYAAQTATENVVEYDKDYELMVDHLIDESIRRS